MESQEKLLVRNRSEFAESLLSIIEVEENGDSDRTIMVRDAFKKHLKDNRYLRKHVTLDKWNAVLAAADYFTEKELVEILELAQNMGFSDDTVEKLAGLEREKTDPESFLLVGSVIFPESAASRLKKIKAEERAFVVNPPKAETYIELMRQKITEAYDVAIEREEQHKTGVRRAPVTFLWEKFSQQQALLSEEQRYMTLSGQKFTQGRFCRYLAVHMDRLRDIAGMTKTLHDILREYVDVDELDKMAETQEKNAKKTAKNSFVSRNAERNGPTGRY